MRLTIKPNPPIPQFGAELEIVIIVDDVGIPEIIVESGLPRPDRHLLLGLVQSVSLLIEEQDPESVAIMESCSVRLDKANEEKELEPGLLIVKTKEGRFGALIVGDSIVARRLARRSVRWFTGTIRLDVP